MNENAAKQKKDRRQLRHGSYSIALTAIVVAGAVILNLIVGEIPSQYTKYDLSGQQLTVLTDQTKEVLSGLQEDVTLYYIVQDSDRDSTVARLLERYEDYSSHVTVVEKDPVLYPQFASQYTDETLTDNSVIVVCGDNSRVVAYEDMYESEFSYTYYSYTTTGFDAEGQLTSAIAAMDSGELPKLYTLTGHNEITLSDTLQQSIEKENIETEELNLVTADAVPDDADCLLICSPTTDLSEAEAEKILNYLRRGGSAIIITDYTTADMTNLDSVLAYYGTELVDGVVIEGDSNYYVQLPYYLVPQINSTDVSEDLSGGNAYVLLAAAQGIETTEDAREDLSITSVLTSSDSSYSKTDVQTMSTYQKESGDIDGPFDLGVLVTETVELTDELLEDTSSVSEDTGLDTSLGTLSTEEQEDAESETAEAKSESADESETEATGESETEAASESETEAAGESETEAASEAESETAGEAAASDTAETKLALFTSSALVDDSANQMVSGGNYQLFVNTLSWACNQESAVSVPVKSLSVSYLTLTSASGNFWSIVTIAVIPGAILVIGLGIWFTRRKR